MAVKTNLGLVAWALSYMGQSYWFGTHCLKCSDSLLSAKRGMYPQHYTTSRSARYKADIKANKMCCDCSGLIKGYWWTNEGGVQVRGLDGRPDLTANNMYERAKVKGNISTLPEIPGVLLHFPGHIGVYIGNGWAVEARGFNYGVVKTRVTSRPWQHWLKSQYIDYIEESEKPTAPTPTVSLKRLLRYTPGTTLMRGDDVLYVQKALIPLGYKPGSADGIFGSQTAAAVKAFQRANKLEVDGIVGKQTWAALEAKTKAPAPKDTEQETETDQNAPAADGSGIKDVADNETDADDPNDDGSALPDEGPALDYGTRILKYVVGRVMQSGADVVAVQTRLTQLDFKLGKVDGIYGPASAEAVKAFQKSAHILADGEVGPNTRKKLAE